MGSCHAGHISGELDDCQLHAEANAKVRHLILAGIANRGDLAFGAAATEATRDQDGIDALQETTAILLNAFGIEIFNDDLATGVYSRVLDRES